MDTEYEIKINSDDMSLKVDIMKIPRNCVIVISNGKAKLRELPSYGEYKIVTHAGKVCRMRMEQGEEF